MDRATFDLPALALAVDVERQRQQLSWVALSRTVGVSTTTIRRMRQADDAEADGVLALVRWLGVAPETFIDGGQPGERLPFEQGMYVRVDMQLVAAATGEPQGAAGRTRTSIQRLVAAARQGNSLVASLTRLSDT